MYEKGTSLGVWIMISVWAFYASLLFGLEKIVLQKTVFQTGRKV